MRYTVVIAGMLAALLLLASAASAFTADSLVISLDDKGNAKVEFKYTLDWFERFFVFFRLADPAAELRGALEEFSELRIDDVQVNEGGAVFYVKGFARVNEKEGGSRYVTPALSFPSAKRILARYWFAPFVRADLSPETTVVIFPDGSSMVFMNAERIPSLEHVVTAQLA